jgi:hypothetical protein
MTYTVTTELSHRDETEFHRYTGRTVGQVEEIKWFVRAGAPLGATFTVLVHAEN